MSITTRRCAVCWIALSIGVVPGCGGGGDSISSSLLDPPESVVAIAGDAETLVSWRMVPGALGYRLYWSQSSPVPLAASNRLESAAASFTHGGLSNGVTYHYVVTAVDVLGESRPSDEVQAMPTASGGAYDPPWASVAPLRTLSLDYDPLFDRARNGAALKTAVLALQPGDRLEIGAGSYSVDSLFRVDLQGTPSAPIWIVAKPGARPVVTRRDDTQNVINFGAGSPTRWLCLRGVEVTGGGAGLKLYSCGNVWIDRCTVHHTGDAAIAANSADTDHLYLTRNDIHDTAGSGEGMYLGANNAAYRMSDSVVALNHVHHTGGSQGDGIEIKQGSYGNWVVRNVVHDTPYPCILLYGTGGMAFNVVECNTCWGSGDNVMQVQGEAIVRNNLLMHGANAFGSHDHQGLVTDLVFVENTLITTGTGAELVDWGGRPNMVFANNVVYSQTGSSIVFSSGSSGVDVAGNVVVGPVSGAAAGWSTGAGLSDFRSVAWDATRRDAAPAATSAILDAGDPRWQSAEDITGAPRVGGIEPGCYDRP